VERRDQSREKPEQTEARTAVKPERILKPIKRRERDPGAERKGESNGRSGDDVVMHAAACCWSGDGVVMHAAACCWSGDDVLMKIVIKFLQIFF
jgi:hypothetical protein